MIDYTGKLNQHDKYVQLIKGLEKKCKVIEYVLVDENDTTLIDAFRNSIISVELKNKWWGTKSSQKSEVYKIKTSPELFEFLKQYETFCKCFVSNFGYIIENVEYTDFGINDIAFFDDQNTPLLYTTTHEGFITARADLI